MSARSTLRILRALLFAAVCVLLALIGHAAAGAGAVAWWAPVLGALTVGVLSWAAAGRERGLVVIGGGVLAAQSALHTLFSWSGRSGSGSVPDPVREQTEALWLRLLLCNDAGAGPAASGRSAGELLRDMRLDPGLTAGPPPGSSGGLGEHAEHLGAAGPTGHAAGHAMSWFGHGGTGMLIAHLVAALACAVWLWQGERALFRLLALTAMRVLELAARVWVVPVRVPRVLVAVGAPVPAMVPPHLVGRPLTRRGPPAWALA